MEWLKKYKFKNYNNDIFNWIKKMDYLLDNNLSNFEYLNEISEEEFLRGKILLYLKKNNIQYWNINIDMVEKDLKELRKDKLNGLVKKV